MTGEKGRSPGWRRDFPTPESGSLAHPRLTRSSTNPTAHPQRLREALVRGRDYDPPGGEGQCPFGTAPITRPENRVYGSPRNPHFSNSCTHNILCTPARQGPAETGDPAPGLSASGPGRRKPVGRAPGAWEAFKAARLPPAAVRAFARQGPAPLHAPRACPLALRSPGCRAASGLTLSESERTPRGLRSTASLPLHPHPDSRSCSRSWSGAETVPDPRGKIKHETRLGGSRS